MESASRRDPASQWRGMSDRDLTMARHLQVGLGVLAMLLGVGTFGFMWFGEMSWIDGFYMAVTTLGTVGYGEARPLGPGGRLFASGFILVGVGTALYTAAAAAEFLIAGRVREWMGRKSMDKLLATMQDHVIVCGYGRSGQNLTRLLESEDIAYVALDNDPQRVRESAGDGNRVVYGDAGRREMLAAAGIAKARAVVITFADVPLALKILHHVQHEWPEVPVIVRTVDDSELDKLLAAGATEVVPEVLEGSLMLASHSLLLLGVPLNRVLSRIRAVREERYSLFRGFFHGATDQSEGAENLQPRLHSVQLAERAHAVGKALGTIGLGTKVQLTGVRRKGARSLRPGEDWMFEAGDIVVLLGRPADLDKAEQKLLRGK